jgi:hypothetical protein
MDALQTARVFVLDDVPSEAMPVVQALSTLGMGVVYHNGSAGFMGGKKLQGVRVLFLDMVLKASGADENDPRQCAGIVAGVLAEVLDPGDDPLLAICWTAHRDILPDFEEAFATTFPRNKQSRILLLEKPTPGSFKDAEIQQQIMSTIDTALDEISPIKALFIWEQMVHDSATSTTRLLSQLVARYLESGGRDWGECALNILAALAIAERGTRLVDESSSCSINAALGALNPVLADALEQMRALPGVPLEAVADQLLAHVRAECESLQRNKQSLVPLDIRAKLNSALDIGEHGADKGVAPGSLYLLDPDSKNMRIVCEDLSIPENLLKELLDDTFQCAKEGFPSDDILIPACSPVLMEFSAPCDFAQKKTRMHRFVLGLILFGEDNPLRDKKFSRGTTAYIRRLGPLHLSKLPGGDSRVCYMFFNAHFIVGGTLRQAADLSPFRRLRKSVVADLSHWLGEFIGRPGHMHVEPSL